MPPPNDGNVKPLRWTFENREQIVVVRPFDPNTAKIADR
jgi:hypothetical protein